MKLTADEERGLAAKVAAVSSKVSESVSAVNSVKSKLLPIRTATTDVKKDIDAISGKPDMVKKSLAEH